MSKLATLTRRQPRILTQSTSYPSTRPYHPSGGSAACKHPDLRFQALCGRASGSCGGVMLAARVSSPVQALSASWAGRSFGGHQHSACAPVLKRFRKKPAKQCNIMQMHATEGSCSNQLTWSHQHVNTKSMQLLPLTHPQHADLSCVHKGHIKVAVVRSVSLLRRPSDAEQVG